MKIHILMISAAQTDGCLAGPHIGKVILHHYPDAQVTLSDVPGDADSIGEAFARHSDMDFILTAGGTGIMPGDIVPDITLHYCDRTIPGIAEMLRFESCRLSPYAALSRGTAGIKNHTIIINIPGSLKVALLCTRILIPVLSHIAKLLHGEAHESSESGMS
jgi:molybdenum cofactor synthesis domain-containing protein